jgi:hypothetical protein
MKTLMVSASITLTLVTGAAVADLRPLTNEQLDRVTAGTAGEQPTLSQAAGGMVVANKSVAAVNDTAAVSLDEGAQDGAKGVNVVNSADSLIAQGVNVWDAKFAGGEVSADAGVKQSNVVMQSEAPRVATLTGYSREPNAVDSSTLSTTKTDTANIDLDSKVNVDTSQQILGQSVDVGIGVGVAGRVGIDLGPAEIGLDLQATSTITTDVGVNGQINLPKPFGSMEAEGDLHSVIKNEGSVGFNISTPPVTIDAIGAVCYTKLGNCTASSIDHSTYSTDTTSDETHTLDTAGALSVQDAKAEYVVIDDSSLTLTNDHAISLASGAQANLAAINAVNAIASMVANSVNVSRTQFDSGASLPMDLSQRNVVIQGR